MKGERELFMQIWAKRKHLCDLCGKFLGHEPKTFHFSHIISKGSEPKGRLDEDNIMLNCLPCHTAWDHGDPKQLANYDMAKQRKQELKIKYNNRDAS